MERNKGRDCFQNHKNAVFLKRRLVDELLMDNRAILLCRATGEMLERWSTLCFFRAAYRQMEMILWNGATVWLKLWLRGTKFPL